MSQSPSQFDVQCFSFFKAWPSEGTANFGLCKKQKPQVLIIKTTTLHVLSRSFVHYFAIATRLLTTWNCLISRLLEDVNTLFRSAFTYAVFFSRFFFFFILIFLQLLVRRILKNEGSRPTYRLLGYLSVFQLGVSLLLAIHQVRKLWSIHLIFLVKK